MTEQEITKIKENYDLFKKDLENKLSNKEITINNKECYLIKEYWMNVFIRSYNNQQSTPKYKTKYTKRNTNTSFSLPTKGPEFLNDITSVIDCLKNGINFILVNKELMEFVFKNNKNELRNYKCISYYTGNKKIIIEFKSNNENNSLLLFDPLKINKKNAYLIEKTKYGRNNIILYENILNKFNTYLINNDEFKNKVKTFDDFINNGNTSVQNKENEKNQRTQYSKRGSKPNTNDIEINSEEKNNFSFKYKRRIISNNKNSDISDSSTNTSFSYSSYKYLRNRNNQSLKETQESQNNYVGNNNENNERTRKVSNPQIKTNWRSRYTNNDQNKDIEEIKEEKYEYKSINKPSNVRENKVNEYMDKNNQYAKKEL